MEKISLREFIDRREAEIKEIRTSLLNELRELKAARVAIDLASGSSLATQTANSRVASSASDAGPTIKEMIISVLEKRNTEATSDQISDWIKTDFQKSVERSSLSPQLSRLKRDLKLDLNSETGKWKLTLAGLLSTDFSEVPPSSLDETRDLGDDVDTLI